MTGYPGAPPYGGQYGNLPYGHPFPPNFAFHNMIPPPPPPQFASSFPANQFAQGTQMQYGNSMAYQNNAQYQQQLGQTQYPQAQVPPPFYNPYVSNNMPSPYGNTYSQTPFGETASTQQTQNAVSRNQTSPVFNIPVTDPRNASRSQADVSGTSSPFQTMKDNSLVALQQQGYPPRPSSHHEDSGIVVEVQDRDNDKTTNFDHSETDFSHTRDQMVSAVPDEPGSTVKLAMDGAEDSYDGSEKSFDPYSVTASQTPNATADAPAAPSPKPKTASTLTLPGLEPALIRHVQSEVPIQPEIEIRHEQKKTLAVQAIQDLASRQIGFEQISKEDIDLALLRDLYFESGVPLALPTDSPSKVAEPSTEPRTTASVALTESKKPATAAPLIKKVASTNLDLPTITAVPNFNLPIVSITSNNPPKPTVQTSAAATSNSTSIPTKDANENATPSTSVNRQDYLAKLQAAKEAVKNKPSPTSASAPVPDRSDYLARLQAAKEAVKQSVVAKPSPPQALTAPQQDNYPTPLANTVSTTRSENSSTPTRASIDALLRQKLEALRKSQLATTSSASTASVAATPTKPQSIQNAQAIPAGQSLNTQEVSTPATMSDVETIKAQSASFFVPGITNGLASLPGLPGLTSELLPTIPAPSGQYQTYPSAQNSVGDVQAPIISQSFHTPLSSAYTDQIPEQQVLSGNNQARKRPVASDFIDSPPTKIPRLSTQAPNSLVADSDEVETEDVNSQADGLRYQANSYEQTGGHGLPPRPEFPPRSTSYQNLQNDVNPDLQAKEDEIRQLRQRIAEATLRKSVKTPTAMPISNKSVTPSIPDVVSSAPEFEQAQMLQKQETAIKNGTKELTMQEKALAAAKLQAQKHLEQIRRQQSSLSAQATKTQHETDHASTDAEREQKLQRKAVLEAKLTSIDAIILTTETDLARIKQEQDKLLSRIQQENDARLALMDEIQGLLQDLEKEMPQTTTDVAMATNEAEIITAQPKADDRPAEVFDAEEPDTESPPSPVQPNLETAIEQPVPISLSSSTITSRTNSPQHRATSSDDMRDAAEDEGEEQMDLDDTSVDMHGVEDEDEDEYDPETADIFYDESLEPEVQEPGDRELDDAQDDYEPVQEIEVLPIASDTELDLTDRDQDRRSSDQDAAMDEESSAAVSISSSDSSYRSDEDECNENDDSASPGPYRAPRQEAMLNKGLVEQPLFAKPGLDSPQEHDTGVSSMAEHKDIPTDHLDDGSNITLQHNTPVIGDISDDTEERPELTTFMDSVPALLPHFVPYESPLSSFKSYRFQPQFLENTAGGFRSLTYSHKINPNVEFCRWELAGGVCNDLGCDAQHFKDITLTDNNLLLQLGSTHEGTTQAEKEAYVAGLKSTIFAMRAKGLKDVDSIASEIAAYRRKFLNDPTRVITNLDN